MAFETSGRLKKTRYEQSVQARHGGPDPRCSSSVCPSGSASALLARLFLVMLAVAVISGCGSYKEELQTAKQQIDRLAQDNQNLSQQMDTLQKEKSQLSDELKLLAEKNKVLRDDATALERDKASLTKELDAARKKTEESSSELKSLKQQKKDLESQVEELKTTSTPSPPLHKTGSAAVAAPTKPVPSESVSAPSKATSPCDAVIQYMKKSQSLVRQYKGEERARLLAKLKEEMAPHMRGAPEKAIKAAQTWVDEVARVWDNPRDDSAYIVLSNKDVVLKSCNKTPEEADF